MGLQARQDMCVKADLTMVNQLMDYSFCHSLCSVYSNQRDERQLALEGIQLSSYNQTHLLQSDVSLRPRSHISASLQ